MVENKGAFGSLINEEFKEEGKKFLSELKEMREKKVSELRDALSRAIYLRAKFMLEELLKLEKKEEIIQGGEEEKVVAKIEKREREVGGEVLRRVPFQEGLKNEASLLKEYITVRILKDLQSVVGLLGEKLHIFGPFKNEDIVMLPIKIAETFIENNVANPIQVEGLSVKKGEI